MEFGDEVDDYTNRIKKIVNIFELPEAFLCIYVQYLFNFGNLTSSIQKSSKGTPIA